MAELLNRSADNVQCLNDDEIDELLDDIDENGDGFISYSDIKRKLEQAHDELVSQPNGHHVMSRDSDTFDNHALLGGVMGPDQPEIPRDDFARIIRQWKIPSLQQVKRKEDEEKSNYKRLPSWRRFRAYWTVHGPEVIFITLVVAMQVAFGVWQLVKYLSSPYMEAFGWGVIMAKACAGALYPTFFFLILSKSRYFSTLLRRSYYISRFFNWDLSQNFHIRIACVALLLVVLHALGHLTGTFVHGSDPANWEAITDIIGPGERHYIDYIRSVPGITGIIGFGLFIILSLLSIPQIRRWNYNLFQLGHLLIYPIIGLMMAHGTAALFQQPLFGYFLAFPTFLVLFERLSRVFLAFYHLKANLEILDGETVEITVVIPKQRLWDYTAGQHIFLQVPEISFFEWHPFTISFCRGKTMMVHIKTDGDWTSKLRKLAGESGEAEILVGVNGPFGAPAQRFYDFRHSVVIGAGIGITPFSAILADLQHNNDLDHGGPSQPGHRNDSDTLVSSDHEQNGASSNGRPLHPLKPVDAPVERQANRWEQKAQSKTFTNDYRRTDFHWIVRDGNYLMWLSGLLNKVSISQKWHREHDEHSHLDIRINTHVTAKRKDIATHVYSWLLEMHRTDVHPVSPLTGLLNPTRFGRPDFNKILDEHYQDMRLFRASEARRKSEGGSSPRANTATGPYKVGVFYCGAAAVGEILADKCSELTIRGGNDGSKIEYHFMTEVFG